MIKNYDQEIEKIYYPENFEPDIEKELLDTIKTCDNFNEFKSKLEDKGIYLEYYELLDYWGEYWGKYKF